MDALGTIYGTEKQIHHCNVGFGYARLQQTLEWTTSVGESKEVGKGIALLSRNIVVGEGAVIKGGEIVDKDLVKGKK